MRSPRGDTEREAISDVETDLERVVMWGPSQSDGVHRRADC